MFTGTLGTIDSQPGGVQPGYFCTGIAEWRGPLTVADVGNYLLNPTNPDKVISRTIPVALTVASQMSLTDHSWWVMH